MLLNIQSPKDLLKSKIAGFKRMIEERSVKVKELNNEITFLKNVIVVYENNIL